MKRNLAIFILITVTIISLFTHILINKNKDIVIEKQKSDSFF